MDHKPGFGKKGNGSTIWNMFMIRPTLICLFALFMATEALAQEAPAPRRMPRTPVSRQVLEDPRDVSPSSRLLQGPAAILDGEKLRIGQTDLRLFGIVPPQLAASFGPQARTELDALAGGQSVSCQIRDRDKDGRLLATCTNSSGIDMALDLLKHGLAVSARGSLVGTELATSYSAAEQAAQNQKIGLWSVPVNAPLIAAPVAAPLPQPKPEIPAPEAAAEVKKEEKPHVETQAQMQAQVQAQAKVAADVLAQDIPTRLDGPFGTMPEEVGFFERYQILISCFLMLATALSIIGALSAQRIRDRRDEIRALAAALRGELMAARSVCFGRAKAITSPAEERTAVWPRIRSTLYQAYVGRLGLLGAELARQIAAIYGQSSDYAALYNPAAANVPHEVTKKQALETLLKRIDEVLPRLAEIERTGNLPATLPHTGATADSSLRTAAALNAMTTLWESVRNFILNPQTVNELPLAPLPPDPPHVTEYTAIIEADMERYKYTENVEALDPPPHRKRK
jgi:endonuclease YncB( thermonuclease family)